MKKSESSLEIRSDKKWEIKTFNITPIPKSQADFFYFEAKKILSDFDERLKSNQKLNSSLVAQSRIKKFPSRNLASKFTRGNSIKPLFSEESKVTQFFDDLNSKFLSVSSGKISLNNVDSEKVVEESSEVVNSHSFELDKRFSESFKAKLLELKKKEDKFFEKKFKKFSTPNKGFKSKLFTSLTEVVKVGKQTRSGFFATTLPAIYRSSEK